MTTRHLIIGDVHSEDAQLQALIRRTEFDRAIFLGDLVDRGPDATGVIKIVDELRSEGRLCALIVGNHDHKIYRYLRGADVTLSDEAQRTVDNLHQNGTERMFMRLLESEHAWVAYRLDRHVFVHAAATREMYRDDFKNVPYMNFFEGGKKNPLFARCFYGYTTGRKTPEGFPERLMDWVQDIPSGFTVWKGHDYIYDEVTFEGNTQGGMLVWMDTGAGKMGDREGKLSGMVLEI